MAKILCIDDDVVGLQMRKLLLEAQGYEVLTAPTGQQGLAEMAKQRVDMVVLDYQMPAMNGGEVAGLIRHKWPRVPIVMLSGYPDDAPAEIRELVDAFVTKGDSTPQFLSVIQRSLNGHDGGRFTILNVDDNLEHRYAITRVLSDAGFEVIEAGTGTEALDRARMRPSLIILDINLPDMLGFDVCRRLKTNPVTREIPVIHMSATYPTQVADAESKESGADRFLCHPQNIYEVVRVVRQQLCKTARA
ncbi:MAG TPA: response regulator [Terriglobales bacterium]|jgi:CheY-like chemotaxis protein|nr:response regulator [Terriglobales bacterium]